MASLSTPFPAFRNCGNVALSPRDDPWPPCKQGLQLRNQASTAINPDEVYGYDVLQDRAAAFPARHQLPAQLEVHSYKGTLIAARASSAALENFVAGAFRAQQGLATTHCPISLALVKDVPQNLVYVIAIGKAHSLLHPLYDQVATVRVYSVPKNVEQTLSV